MVAYSGGTDSTFLLKAAKDVLGDKALAVTAASATYPAQELAFSKKMARQIGVRYKVIKTAELKDRNFVLNPVNRCYFCKKELFSKLNHLAAIEKLNFVIDATNVSDKSDFRPGEIAKAELGIRSPLVEAGFTKEAVREHSRKLGLCTWDKPNLACLASRVPYGVSIKPRVLNRINKAENLLRRFGFRQTRVRHYDSLCRIEVLKEEIPFLFDKRKPVIQSLKNLGYDYVTVDLEGYRVGSMNEIVRK